MNNQVEAAQVEKPVIRTMTQHLEEITTLFLERLDESILSPGIKSVQTVPQAFYVLSNKSISKAEREALITSLSMAFSSATESFLFEYLLHTGFYKNEDDFCQDGERCSHLREDKELPYLDMRMKSEMTIYAQLDARLFSDQELAMVYYGQMIHQFDIARKEKVVLQFCELRDKLKDDITGLETQMETAMSTEQLTELSQERFESQLCVLRNVHLALEKTIINYYG